MSADLMILLDGLILVFLCVTIFYAARLSMFMKTFREGREGMQILIRDLTKTISKAESSIVYTKDQVTHAEKELRDVINEAKYLADELKFMNENGNDIADRMEKIVTRNRELADLVDRAERVSRRSSSQTFYNMEDDDDYDDFDDELDNDDERDFLALEDGAYNDQPDDEEDEASSTASSNARSFAIFDKELAAIKLAKEEIQDNAEESLDDFDDGEFLSKAEQDLYEALQRRKKVKTS